MYILYWGGYVAFIKFCDIYLRNQPSPPIFKALHCSGALTLTHPHETLVMPELLLEGQFIAPTHASFTPYVADFFGYNY